MTPSLSKTPSVISRHVLIAIGAVTSFASTRSRSHSISCPGSTSSRPACAARIFSAIVIARVMKTSAHIRSYGILWETLFLLSFSSRPKLPRMKVVGAKGLEPLIPKEADFKSAAYANSATPPFGHDEHSTRKPISTLCIYRLSAKRTGLLQKFYMIATHRGAMRAPRPTRAKLYPCVQQL